MMNIGMNIHQYIYLKSHHHIIDFCEQSTKSLPASCDNVQSGDCEIHLQTRQNIFCHKKNKRPVLNREG